MRLRFSDKMHDVLGFTAEEALRTGWRAAGVDHLMLGLLRHRDNDACRALTESGIDPGDLKRSLDEHLFRPEPLNFGEPEAVHPTRAAAEVIRLSGYEALKHSSGTIRTVHLLLAISLSEGSASSEYLLDRGAGHEILEKKMNEKGMLHEATEHAPVIINEKIVGALGEQLGNLISSSGFPS